MKDWDFTATGTQHLFNTCNPPHGDTAAEDEYPGDGGLNTVKPFTFGSGVGGAPGNPLSFQ